METTISTSSEIKRRKRRPKKRRAKKKDELEGEGGSKSPSRHLVIKKQVKPLVIKENVRNKISELYFDSVIEVYDSHILNVQNQENQDSEKKMPCEKRLDQTVDLCNDDSSNSSLLIESSQESKPKHEPQEIDLCRNFSKQNEVIDLTESTGMAVDAASDAAGPTVIDITEDEEKDMQNVNPQTEEIFVIGTYSTCSVSNFNKTNNTPIVKLSNRLNDYNIIKCSTKFKKNFLGKSSILNKIFDRSTVQSAKKFKRAVKSSCSTKVGKIGGNVYVNSPVTLPSSGLRPIIIDGSNVAFVYSSTNFCCKRLEICINYFKKRGHKVTAFVPQFRINNQKSDDPGLLRKLERRGDVVLTPSKKIDGMNIVPYDDRFIVQTAVLKGGIIVTRDNYNDLLRENPAWAETIKYRTLAFTWVDDVLMFPKDPLGEFGPSLEEFLKFH